MRILVYGINYAPELTGIGKYTGEMAAWLAKAHDVAVVTAMPYYPQWEVSGKYKGRWWFTEDSENVRIYRCPLYVPKKVTAIKRIIHEFSFLLSTLPVFFGIAFKRKYDVVICISPPFHLAFLPLIYAKLRGAKLVSHIQDLQVDAAKDLQMIKNKSALDFMFKLEKFFFKQSTAVSTISPGMRAKIAQKGVPSTKMLMFPNWVDGTLVRPMELHESLRREFDISYSSKVVLYSGNLGEKQGLEVVVDVAKQLSHRKEIVFVIVGSGGGKENLIKLVSEARLDNVKFFPLQPYEQLSALLAIADLHLVLQKKSASDLVMPSKLTAILAVGGCPLVTALPGTTLYDVISDHRLGILVEPESSAALLAGIEFGLNSGLSEFKQNARKYSEKFLSKENILTEWELNLKKLVSSDIQLKEQLI